MRLVLLIFMSFILFACATGQTILKRPPTEVVSEVAEVEGSGSYLSTWGMVWISAILILVVILCADFILGAWKKKSKS